MFRILKIILAALITDLYFFPLELWAFPGINSKMILAAIGLALVAYDLVKYRSFLASGRFLLLCGFAMAVSIVSLLTMVYNQTPDSAYAGYFVSFFVWLTASYTVCHVIYWAQGRIDVHLVVYYLAAVCVFQCVSAIVIDSVPAVQRLVDAYFNLGQVFMRRVKRIYGLGAMLDVAGIHFSLVLVAIAYLISQSDRLSRAGANLLLLAFLVISILGNIIGRTTSVGMIVGLIYMIFSSAFGPKKQHVSVGLWLVFFSAVVISSVILYNSNVQARGYLRFAFEGFFNLIETGRWESGSTEILQSMVVWPDKLSTWIIGDGYFDNASQDPNFLGNVLNRGFYMGTDIGYLRFIFYFGVPGLLCMMGVIILSAQICMKAFPKERVLFLLALLTGLIVWLKVSTDIFFFFALFISSAILINYEDPGFAGE